MKELQCGTEDIMEMLAVSRQTVSNYTDQGMPKISQGKFDAVACLRWAIAREHEKLVGVREGQDLEAQETRWKKAQADLKELELALKRGLLAPLDLVKSEWDRYISSAKTQLLGLPSKVAVKVRAARDTAEIKQIIETEILQVLHELSSSDGTPASGGGSSEDDRGSEASLEEIDSASAGHDRKPVGRRKAVRTAGRKSNRARKVADVKG